MNQNKLQFTTEKDCSSASRYSYVFCAVSMLNDSTCADLMVLINLDNYQEEIDLTIFHFVTMSRKGISCFKVHFHRCCRAPESASIQM